MIKFYEAFFWTSMREKTQQSLGTVITYNRDVQPEAHGPHVTHSPLSSSLKRVGETFPKIFTKSDY
jgi:hypothetical protein